MIDISGKFSTLRYARAEGILKFSPTTTAMIKNGKIPKGDVLVAARLAGITAVKKTPDFITFCHPMPIDYTEVTVQISENQLLITAEVKAVWKTGVEMEALTGVTAALLNAYDMLKPVDKDLEITDIRLVEKKGGKSDFIHNSDIKLKAGILIVSDSTAAGERQDASGAFLKTTLRGKNMDVCYVKIVPDESDLIREGIIKGIEDNKLNLLISTGGTGLGKRDITPEVTKKLLDKEIPGIAETIRNFGHERTPFAMLSREVAGIYNNCLIINLPGSLKAVKESLQSLFPGLLHAFPMLRGEGHQHD